MIETTKLCVGFLLTAKTICLLNDTRHYRTVFLRMLEVVLQTQSKKHAQTEIIITVLIRRMMP